jgi:hypothetical protein
MSYVAKYYLLVEAYSTLPRHLWPLLHMLRYYYNAMQTTF